MTTSKGVSRSTRLYIARLIREAAVAMWDTRMRLLDLCCGKFGWSKPFAARGWECAGVDLVRPSVVPDGCIFYEGDLLKLQVIDGEFFLKTRSLGRFDFGCASTPCEEFAVFGMAHFHPNPRYPFTGIELFNHARGLFELAEIPYVMENTRCAWKFVGQESGKCGPFHLWGNAVPPILPGGITKGFGAWDREYILTTGSSKSKRRQELKAEWAEIPGELAGCVADYAERLVANKGFGAGVGGEENGRRNPNR